MSTALSLFPARIRFVNQDGTLTPEAYRAMQMLYGRVGGVLGDVGADTFAVMAGGSDDIAADVTALEMVAQPAELDALAFDVVQPVTHDSDAIDVVQPASDRSMTKPEAVAVGASPFTFTAKRDGYLVVTGGTVTKQEYGRTGTFTDVGLLTSMLPIQLGDAIKVTYTATPTLTFIPR